MQMIAQSWLIYRLTNSPLILGLVAFAGQIPAIFVTPLGGLLSDRADRRIILIAANITSMALAFVLAILVLSKTVAPWHIILISVISGIAWTFEMTTRHSFIPEMVDKKEDLGNAIALNSVLFNVARLIGPAIAGVLIATAGEGICFILNGVSFITVIAALMMMNLKKRDHTAHKHPLKELKEGFRSAFGSVAIRYIIFLMAFISLTGSAVMVLLPVFAKEILHGSAQTFGLLTGAVGLGALTGALYMASRKTVRGLGTIIIAALMLYGTALIAASFTGIALVTMLFLVLCGAGTMLHTASSNTIIQTVTEDDVRGRVMSFFLLSFSAFGPLGSLIAGWLAGIFGVRIVLLCGGVSTLVAGIVFLAVLPEIRKHLKPVYIKKGIIPSDTAADVK